jgi:hypothetical protein
MENQKSTSVARPLPARRTGDPKLQGELVELAFLHKAVSLGFAVAKPYGDSERYDFIVDYRDNIDRKLLRVQVKSTALLHQGCYRIWCAYSRTRYSRAAYSRGQIDFLVAYIIPENAWYVFPVAVLGVRTCVKLFTQHRKTRSRFEEFREAWHLMSDPVQQIDDAARTTDAPASWPTL